MKNNQFKHIEKRLSDASKQMIPEDMYNRITQSIAQEERKMSMNTTTTVPTAGKKRLARWLGVAAAVCILLVCGIFGGNYYFNNLRVDSIVDIDVNPGIEISTNKKDVVLDVIAVNSDAEKVLDGMNMKNIDLKVAVNAIIGSMVKNGYLVDGENSILVTVQNKDAQRAAHIRNLILSDINESLKDNNITASVVNQTVADNADAKEFAAAQGISFGKATLILNLCAKEAALNGDTLARMSIREIAALVVEKNIDIRDIVDYDADDSIWENIKDAVDDADEDNNDNQSTTAISAAKAKEIALAHAGISASDASFIRAELDTDDGVQVYEIEFTSGTAEYDYEVNAQTGAVITFSKEALEIVDPGVSEPETAKPEITKPETTKPETTKPSQGSVITAAEAKEIALNHAGVSAASATFVKVELDTDDGVQIYEVEFCVGATEYDYEINALTGSVIQYESEIDD